MGRYVSGLTGYGSRGEGRSDGRGSSIGHSEGQDPSRPTISQEGHLWTQEWLCAQGHWRSTVRRTPETFMSLEYGDSWGIVLRDRRKEFEVASSFRCSEKKRTCLRNLGKVLRKTLSLNLEEPVRGTRRSTTVKWHPGLVGSQITRETREWYLRQRYRSKPQTYRSRVTTVHPTVQGVRTINKSVYGD